MLNLTVFYQAGGPQNHREPLCAVVVRYLFSLNHLRANQKMMYGAAHKRRGTFDSELFEKIFFKRAKTFFMN